MTRMSTLNPYGVYVRNTNHFVMSDWYTEQCDNGVSLSGTAGNPSGRITIEGVNCDFSGRTNAHLMTINDYEGQVFLSDQIYVNPPVSIVQTGTRAMNIVLFSTFWYDTSLSFIASTASLSVLGNQSSSSETVPPDSYTAQTLTDLAMAMDDLQLLGNLDLDLNFPFVLPLLYCGSSGPNCSRGDMNCDQVVDITDLPLFVEILLDPLSQSNCYLYLANLNGDLQLDGNPKVDGLDIQPFVSALLGS